MRRADRLFQIIQVLRRASRPITAAAIAEELEVSRRTIYRDIADLMGQRVPITGEAGFGYVLDAGYDMPPLMLNADEIEAIVLGAQWVADRSDKALSTAARDVIAKIAAVVPEHLRPFIEVPSVGIKPLDPQGERLDTTPIRMAIRHGNKLLLRYRTEVGEESERTIWPVVLGYAEATSMIIAWCELRQDFRHFRTDRVVGIELLDERHGWSHARLRRRWEVWREARLGG